MQTIAAQIETEAPARFTHQQILKVLSGILLCIFLAAIDQTVVIPAVPAMAADLHGFNHLAWIVSAYLLTSTAMTPIYGKLSDIYGPRKPLLVALAVFGLASVLCANAGSLWQLVAARAVQGIGGAGLMAMAQASIADGRQPARARALPGLHGFHLGHRLDRRADRRRLDHRCAVLALDFLAQPAARPGRDGDVLSRTAAAAAARRQGADRLDRRDPADRRGERPAAGAELGRGGDGLDGAAAARHHRARGSCCWRCWRNTSGGCAIRSCRRGCS